MNMASLYLPFQKVYPARTEWTKSVATSAKYVQMNLLKYAPIANIHRNVKHCFINRKKAGKPISAANIVYTTYRVMEMDNVMSISITL